MEAQDLRIGNLVKGPYGKTIKLLSVEKDASMLRPIPITPEWLERLGCDSLGEYGYGIGEFHMKKETKGYYFPVDNKFISIKTVHQLQNLYHSLTGKELTIKEEIELWNKNNVIAVAEKLYSEANPNSNKDVPSYVYEVVEQAKKEMIDEKSDMFLYDWCKRKIKPKT